MNDAQFKVTEFLNTKIKDLNYSKVNDGSTGVKLSIQLYSLVEKGYTQRDLLKALMIVQESEHKDKGQIIDSLAHLANELNATDELDLLEDIISYVNRINK